MKRRLHGEGMHDYSVNNLGQIFLIKNDVAGYANQANIIPKIPDPNGFGFWNNYCEYQNQLTNTGDNYYPFDYEEFPYHYKKFCNGNPNEFRFQDFDFFVVIDFEATCGKAKVPSPQEIIEFPSVLVNCATGMIVACFQTYVRPSHHCILSDFCKELTGIQQCQVDRGVSLHDALAMHDKWLEEKGVKQTKFAVVTWSDWDCRVMLESECNFKKLKKHSYFDSWINLQIPFQAHFKVDHCKLQEAMSLAGLTWEGRPHCGLDDALNTARLVIYLMFCGVRLSITTSLVESPSVLNANKETIQSPVRNQNLAVAPLQHVHPILPVFCHLCHYYHPPHMH